MKLVNLSNSDLKVSPICLGTWQFNDNVAGTSMGTWNAQDVKVSKEIVDKAIEMGVNFFDTAEAYRNSEATLGRILQGRRKNVIVASKVGFCATPGCNKPEAYRAEDIEDSLEQSLRNLQTDYLDLYQVHWPQVIADQGEMVDTLKRLQSKGKIRYYGISNFGVKDMEAFYSAGGRPITNQLPYSLFWRAIEYDIVPYCAERNLDVLAYSPLAQGLLSGKYTEPEQFPEGRRRTRLFDHKSTTLAAHTESGAVKEIFEALDQLGSLCKEGLGKPMVDVALNWILANPRIKSVVVGASTAAQVKEICDTFDIPEDVMEKLNELSEPIKKVIGTNPDMWFTKSRIH